MSSNVVLEKITSDKKQFLTGDLGDKLSYKYVFLSLKLSMCDIVCRFKCVLSKMN